jgi:chromate transporter
MTPPRETSLLRLGWTFLKIGTFGFGGLAANLALIEQELVDRQQALTHEAVTEALTYTKLLPGSTGVQVVSYLGWRLRGWPGVVVGTAAFVAPAAAAMLTLAALYGRFARLPSVSLALHGMAASVLGLLVLAVWRLGRPNIVDRVSAVLAGAAFVVGYWMHLPAAWIVVLGGLIGIAIEWRREGGA